MSSSYFHDLIKQNSYQILILVLANISVAVIVLLQVGTLTETQVRDVLTTSSVLLGITTATIAFFGQYVENTTDDLFKKGSALKKLLKEKGRTADYEKVSKNLPKPLLQLIFLQFFLWWSLMADGISTLLSFLAFYNNNTKFAGTLALSFMLMGILTLLIWMSLFVLSSTPGKSTYNALKDNKSDNENKVDHPQS